MLMLRGRLRLWSRVSHLGELVLEAPRVRLMDVVICMIILSSMVCAINCGLMSRILEVGRSLAIPLSVAWVSVVLMMGSIKVC